ncbi:hypothetical protein H0H92_015830 [Tricholoma furcatifolium]|nr:hypothetical protein H0H92_015830 [Tricholoma furcatifolium]
METIDNPTFNLALSLQLAHDEQCHTGRDDAPLAFPEPDKQATQFWQKKSSENVNTGHAQLAIGPDLLPSSKRAGSSRGQNARVHKKRRMQREAQAQQLGHHAVRPEVAAAHVHGAASISTSLKREDLPVGENAFIARHAKLEEQGWSFQTLGEALDAGYQLIQWDGRTCKPLVCKDGRIFAVLAGQPNDPSYEESCRLATEAIMQEGRNATFTQSELNHKRGNFPAVNVGVTMGLGATYPTNLGHSSMMDRLLNNPHIQRLAHFADGTCSFLFPGGGDTYECKAAFNLWAPKVHQKFCDHLGPLFQDHTYLRRIFPRSIFPGAAFNFGPNVFTVAHRDSMNLAVGWCAIQALGNYDPTKGGHLVLPGLRLVIEFPPGSLILIPSATVTHLNIPICEGECRVSFTQFCSGGLFRYVENGFRTDNQLLKEDPKKSAKLSILRETRWHEDFQLYSLLSDCVAAVE